jgi:hypothetical protein
MEHFKSSFYFQSGASNIYRVDYSYGEEWHYLIAKVYLNDELIATFDRLPPTKTHNPTKSQAAEIIVVARKLNKLK